LTSKIGEIEAVIFDLDETLIDAQQGLKAAYEKVADLMLRFLSERNVSVNQRKLVDSIKRIDDEMNRLVQYNRDIWWQKVVDSHCSNIRLSEPLIKTITRSYWEAYENASVPYPDTVATLEYLRKEGYKLGIVTDDDGDVGRKRGRIHGLSFVDIFDTIIVSGDEVAERKPSPLPFLVAADKLGASPRRCAAIGDKPFTDIEGGMKAGMTTILVVRRRWDSSIEADYEVTTLSELKTLL
jgi:putative hydrolase of the HAD superfamily